MGATDRNSTTSRCASISTNRGWPTWALEIASWSRYAWNPARNSRKAVRVYRLTPRMTSPPSTDAVFGLEVMAEGRWRKEYEFTLQPRELSDFAGMCHYHQTSPESHFTRQRICSLPTAEGRITLSDEKLIETREGSRQERLLSGEREWRAKLLDLFGVVLPE